MIQESNQMTNGEGVTNFLSLSTYWVSFCLILGDSWSFLNSNVGAIGVIVAIATFLMNFYFNLKRDKRENRDSETRTRKDDE
jgi:uncharacterized membrane protein